MLASLFWSKDAPIHAACARGDVDAVRTLIEDGADLQCIGKDGTTPLTIASARGHLACVDALLAAGADVNAPDATPSKKTALHAAAEQNHLGVAELLLSRGADTRALNSNKLTPLHRAVGSIEIVRAVLAADAKRHADESDADRLAHFIELRCSLNHRAFDLAVARGHASVVQVLIDAGTDIEACILEDMNMTPLAIACVGKHESVMRVLLAAGAKTDVIINSSMTPLIFLAMQSRPDLVTMLLDAGADIHAVLPDELVTALYCAAAWADLETVTLLLARGANVNALSAVGTTPLHGAAYNSSAAASDIARALLAAGADINVRANEKDATPLHIAIFGKNFAVAQTLIASGADVHLPAVGVITPLHAAMYTDEDAPDVVQALLTAGADIDRRGLLDMTPLMSACISKLRGSAQVLIDANADAMLTSDDGVTPLHILAEHGDIELLQLLLDRQKQPASKRINVNVSDGFGATPLHYAVTTKDNSDVITALLASGANVSACDADGFTPVNYAQLVDDANALCLLHNAGGKAGADTSDNASMLGPLHAATKRGDIAAITRFLAAGVDVNAASRDGTTSLHLASQQDAPRMTQLLLQHGANASTRTAAGNTPLQFATTFGHERVADILTIEEARLQRLQAYRLIAGSAAVAGLAYVASRGRAHWRAYRAKK